MTTATIRKKLHDYINIADDKKVEAIYTIVEDDLENGTVKGAVKKLSKTEKIIFIKQASFDPLFLADLKEIKDDFDAIDGESL